MTSISDVAKKAGVSIATVSRVINNNGYPVSTEVRNKVLRVAEELDYVPNRSAQALRQSKKNGIALLVREISDPYFSEITHGVMETSVKHDAITAIFSTMRDPKLELKSYDLIIRQQYDGLIIAGGAYYDDESQKEFQAIVERLKQQGCRIIALAPQGFDVPMISIDNVNVGYKATSYLISKGHRRIAFLGGDENHLADKLRLEGYAKALSEQDVDVSDSLIIRSNYSISGGYSCCRELVEKKIGFTAVFASNDHIALGALSYLQDSGIKVPEQVSVIGAGGFYQSLDYYENIRLSTIAFPFYEMGRLAVEYLLSEESLQCSTVLDVSVEERGSVIPVEG